ncbi:hypothetical protein DABAL43B_1655 [Psychrobacter sp. DAB_AL43B]|nr:hypothetical protein DABAL43B_1655 [Psychrobacter sp. DAB_AL43B]
MFGHIDPYLLSQLYVLLTLFLVYQLGKKVWSQETALLGSVLKLWIAAFMMLAIFAPHLYWLITHDWLPLSYANGRSQNDAAGTYDIKRYFS